MKIDTLPIGLYDENIYILHDQNKVLIIDPGKHANKIIEKIGKDETVQGILITHGHEDHIGAVDDVYDYYQVPVYIDSKDALLVKTRGTAYTGGCMNILYSPLQYYTYGQMQIGDFLITVYSTPGHTSGSVCIRYKNVLFTGDTLFAQSIGRTDFFSGSDEKMAKSLEFLKTLPNDLIIYPGHGPSSTIGHEKVVNYYLNH